MLLNQFYKYIINNVKYTKRFFYIFNIAYIPKLLVLILIVKQYYIYLFGTSKIYNYLVNSD